jgi:hypothetical protein
MLKRRSFFGKVAVAMSLLAIPTLSFAKPKGIKGRFIHMVFFYLKEDTDPMAFIRATENFLMKVDEIKGYHLGTPAMTPRDVVDNSYSVSLVATFNTKEDQDIYQSHQAHLDYIAANKHLWTEVKIFDSWGAHL